MQDRAFVLVPLRDVAPGWRHPVNGLGLEELLAALPLSEIERLP
jgi:2-amino-4-hydroxy-6-hydroxymethyldihydropteridine diphosphokinase